MSRALISLGGNQGNVPETFRNAALRLNSTEQVAVTACSRLYSTTPVGELAGQPFLNAALVLETQLEAHQILDVLQQIETELGRIRTVRWGPRTIDLDVILFGEQTIRTDRLIVPHPAAFYRRFVLDPACEIAGDWTHPMFNCSLQHVKDRLCKRPLPVAIVQRFPNENSPNSINLQQFTKSSTVKLTNSTADASIVFDRTNTLQLPYVVHCDETQAGNSLIEQVLIAATDTPEVVGEFPSSNIA